MAVLVEGHFDPGEVVEVFPVVDLEPTGRPIATVKIGRNGRCAVRGLAAGNYFFQGARKRVQVAVLADEAGEPEPIDSPPRLSDDEIREKLAETRPDDGGGGEIVHGARSTADTKPKRKLLGRRKK